MKKDIEIKKIIEEYFSEIWNLLDEKEWTEGNISFDYLMDELELNLKENRTYKIYDDNYIMQQLDEMDEKFVIEFANEIFEDIINESK